MKINLHHISLLQFVMTSEYILKYLLYKIYVIVQYILWYSDQISKEKENSLFQQSQ
jgi:hypothetical protein